MLRPVAAHEQRVIVVTIPRWIAAGLATAGDMIARPETLPRLVRDAIARQVGSHVQLTAAREVGVNLVIRHIEAAA